MSINPPGRARRHVLAVSIILAALVLAVTAAGGCAGPTESRDDFFTVTGPARIVVENQNGAIAVTAGSENEVHVQATLRGAPVIDYEIEQIGDTVRVSAGSSWRWWHFFRNAGVDLKILVPEEADLELETKNGRVEISGVHGSASFRTSNGRVVLSGVSGDFSGRTSNGYIEINEFQGRAAVRSSNGGISVWNAAGVFDLETSNGSISFHANLVEGGDNRLITSNGDVEAILKGEVNVDLDARTSNGKLTCEFPIELADESRLVGKIGDGGTGLYIRTSNGDIAVR